MHSIPFSMTPDAQDFLRSRLNEMPPSVRPVLMMTTSQSDGLKPPRWTYEGESFVVGYFEPHDKPKLECTESELFGHRVSITSEALKQLSGRTLKLRRVAANRGLMKNTRYVMVADSAPEPPGSDTGERVQRGFAIAAMTILGGFTGMGVCWITYGIVAAILRIPEDKIFGSNIIFPLFVTGWIIGAIISFFFFRFVYKPGGRTRFKQEQIRRKYLGYGGLEGEANWWIFLGMPASLMAILLLALAPLAHTDGQKAYGTVILLMIVLGGSLYFSDKLPHRLVLWLGLSGWVLTFIIGFLFFKIHGP